MFYNIDYTCTNPNTSDGGAQSVDLIVAANTRVPQFNSSKNVSPGHSERLLKDTEGQRS